MKKLVLSLVLVSFSLSAMHRFPRHVGRRISNRWVKRDQRALNKVRRELIELRWQVTRLEKSPGKTKWEEFEEEHRIYLRNHFTSRNAENSKKK